MPLTTISLAAGAALTYQPLLLASVTFLDGSVLYASTEAVTYGGHDYKAIIKDEAFVASQALSTNGIVQAPEVTLTLIDSAKELWAIELEKGFKGCELKLVFVFRDAATGTFSSDSRTAFLGLCDPPQADASTFTVSAVSKVNLSRQNLPKVPVSSVCPWSFPCSSETRAAAANDPDSAFYECGYSPDVAGPNARGNYQTGTTPFTFCNHTRADCVQRMGNSALHNWSKDNTPTDIEQDKSGRHTGTFGGIFFGPPQTWRGKAFLTSQKAEGWDSPNLAKYDDYHRLLYGKTFINPVIMNVVGDPNYTWCECTICVGQIHDDPDTAGPIEKVLLNDDEIPYLPSHGKINLAWSWVNTGSKFGKSNRDKIYDGKGDPYGSLATIRICVLNSLQASTGPPTVKVLTRGPKIRVWASAAPTDFTLQYTSNPAWIILDLLTWTNFSSADIDLQTFVDAAAYFDGLVEYVDLLGSTVTHPRYSLGLVLAERKSAAEVMRGVLASCCSILRPSITDGKLQIFVKRPDDASVYSFDESNILMTGSGVNLKTSLGFTQRKIADTPNCINVQFMDEDDFYTANTISVLDSQDISRAQQQVDGPMAAEGITSWDQARRVLQTMFAEEFRGNPRSGLVIDNNGTPLNDTGGTLTAKFTTTARSIDLRCGDVITLSSTAYGIDSQLFRITSLKPAADFDTCEITANWHEADWYEDIYGQDPSPRLQSKREQSLLRSPYRWSPNWEVPDAHDSLYPVTDKSFALSQQYSALADGTTQASLSLLGYLPVNAFSPLWAPFCRQGAADLTGGSMPAATYWLALVGIDADGLYTVPSTTLKVELSATGKVNLPNIKWGDDTVKYNLYAGTDPNHLTLQMTGTGTPSSLALTSYKVSDEGMPDSRFDHLVFTLTKVFHSGVFGMDLSGGFTSTTMTYAPGGFTVNQWAGYTVSILGRAETTNKLRIWDFKVLSNTADTLTLDCTSLLSLGLSANDVVVMRAQADIASDNTIGCTGFVNGVDYYDVPYQIKWVSGSKFFRTWGLNGIYIDTNSPAPYQVGDKLYVTGVNGVPAANGVHTVSVVSADQTNFYCDSGSLVPLSSGSWTGGGLVSQVTSGMATNAEKGRLVRIIDGLGVGQTRIVASNTSTTLTIVGSWSVIPDSTSIFIITDTAESQRYDAKPSHNSDATTLGAWMIPVTNMSEQMLLVEGWAASAQGKLALDAPGREIYLFGGPGPGSAVYYLITFGLGIGASLITGTSVTPIYTVRKRGTLDSISAICKTWPTGADVILDVLRVPAGSAPGTTPTSILDGSHLHIPAGATARVMLDTFATDPLQIEEGDLLTVSVLQVGSTIASKDITVQIKVLEN